LSENLLPERSRLRRRSLLGIGSLGLLGLSGCGFRPLYGSSGVTTSGPVATELAAVDVSRIPERVGQLMRRALQQRLWVSGQSSPRYTLTAYPSFGVEQEGIRPYGTPTRIRITATASWWLTTNATPPQPVANGAERSFDAFDLPDGQFFAADAARDAMMVRLVDQMAEDIVSRLALHFGARDAG
jgi:LPS-assembly lipoprotein